MSSVTELNPSDEVIALTAATRPRPLDGGITASARRITSANVTRMGSSGKGESWQEDAWDMYDLLGEQRYLANTIAGRMSQARLYVGKMPTDTTEDVTPVETGPAYDAFSILSRKARTLAQIINRAGINLFVAGDGYLVGVPEGVPEKPPVQDITVVPFSPATGISPFGSPTDQSTEDEPDALGGMDLAKLVYRFYSVTEVKFKGGNEVDLLGAGGKPTTYNLDTILCIRIHREHPRRWWQADSPVRSSLPVLRELVGLTMHVSSQVDSRLAGAGMFFIPESADRALRAASGLPEDGEDVSPLVEALMEAMVTALGDRGSASAQVPIMPVVPDETIALFRYLSFATPLDAEAKNLRDEALRRIALGEDCPPELLLGTSGMNHWGAWLVREDVVTTHIEPPLALICDALTTEFLWPILEQQGIPPEEYEQYVVWYDVSALIIRPNRTKDAFAVHAAGALNDETLRHAAGFDDDDAPAYDGIAGKDPVMQLALDMVRANPLLLQAPGLKIIVDQLQAMADGGEIPAIVPPASPTAPGEGTQGGPTADSTKGEKPPQGGIPNDSAGKDTPDDQKAGAEGVQPW